MIARSAREKVSGTVSPEPFLLPEVRSSAKPFSPRNLTILLYLSHSAGSNAEKAFLTPFLRLPPDTLPPQGMKLNELLKACFDPLMKVGKEQPALTCGRPSSII